MAGPAKVVNGPMQLIPTSGVTDRVVTAGAAASAFVSPALNANTRYVFWTLTGGAVRFTIDGSDPSATNGHQIPSGSSGIWSVTWANAVRVIREGGTDGTFAVSECNYLG